MSARALFAAFAVLALTTPALARPAQDAPAAAVAPLTEADIDAAGELFSARMEEMGAELEAAVAASPTDPEAADAAITSVMARYVPEIESFAALLERFLADQGAAAETPQEAQALTAAASAAGDAIRSIPQQVRAGVMAGVVAAQAAEAEAAAQGAAAMAGAAVPQS